MLDILANTLFCEVDTSSDKKKLVFEPGRLVAGVIYMLVGAAIGFFII